MNESDLVQLCADIQLGWNAQQWMAKARQARIAKANQVLDKAHIEGIGQHDMKVDMYAYHSYGQKYGYDIWNDQNFRREYKRDNPAVKIIHERRKNKVGFGD